LTPISKHNTTKDNKTNIALQNLQQKKDHWIMIGDNLDDAIVD
jgi:hypothetical protein